jgi:hypothetical protein
MKDRPFALVENYPVIMCTAKDCTHEFFLFAWFEGKDYEYNDNDCTILTQVRCHFCPYCGAKQEEA